MEERKKEDKITYQWMFPFFIGLVSILIRIPKIPHIYGYDGFEIIWMAHAIKNGALIGQQTWLIHPLSYLGFYPFSQYPIGLPLILAAFLAIGIPLTVSLVTIDILLTVICVIGAYKLSKMFFQKEIYKNTFLIMILLGSKDFYNYTYFTVHPRGVLLALSPWFLYFLFKIRKGKKLVSSIKLLALFSVMILFYRISWLYIIYLIPFAFMIILSVKKIKEYGKRILESKVLKVAFLFSAIGIMVVGFVITPDFDVSLQSPIVEGTTIISQIVTLGMIYFSSLGIISLFWPIGLLSILFIEKSVCVKKRMFLLVTILFMALSWKIPVYSIVLFLPIYAWISVLGIKTSVDMIEKRMKFKYSAYLICSSLILGAAIMFHIIYSLAIVSVKITYFVTLGAIIIYGLFVAFQRYILKIRVKRLMQIFIFSLIIGNVFFLQTTYEGQERYASIGVAPFTVDYSQNHITEDELLVIDYIKTEGIEGIIITSSTTLARRIGGMGFLPTIPGYHIEHPLFYGWVSVEEVLNNTQFNLTEFIDSFSLKYQGASYEDYILSQIRHLNITRVTTINTLISLNVQYLVVIKNPSDNSIYPYLFHPYGNSSYYIFDSLNRLNPTFSTDYLAVFKIY